MIFFWIIAAYLIGSVPTGYLITKALKGTDIREHGSGNPGATNVIRVAGIIPGIMTFIIDFLKGFVPVILAIRYFGNSLEIYWIIIGLAALAGHMWTIFLGFKGGKGVATSAGIFFALIPIPTAAAFVLFWIVFTLTKRTVSISSIVAAIFLPVFSLFAHKPVIITLFAGCAAALIIFQHRSNIVKLLNGTESSFKRGPNG